MIVKEMKPFAKPIGADRHEMRRLSYGSAGAAFVNFADSIITKYTKVLNYQFPTASLTLLTQAEADRQAEHDRNRQVEVNWKLITYLVRNVHMSITQPLVWNQLRQNVRESIDRLELTDKKQAADMRQIYRRFQDTVREVIHGGIEARDAKETQLTAAAVLKDRLEKTTGYREILKFLDNIQTDNTDIIENTGTRDMRSTYRQDEKPEVVSIFSRAFFLNLNHLVNDNRLPDHREIWRVSNEQSQKDHSVKMWVDRMAGMTDPEKKLEILQTLVQKYGIRSVQRSINAMSSASFEKIKDSVKLYRYYVSGVSDDDTGIGADLTVMEEAGTETDAEGSIIRHEAGMDTVSLHTVMNPVKRDAEDYGQKKQYETGYDISPEFIYRDYIKAQEDVLDILEKAEDKVTAGILEEKITEYQQVFLQSVLDKNGNTEEMGAVTTISEDNTENPEIFSDWEINRLRLFVDRKEQEDVTSEDGDTPEKALLTRIMNKLWTFACREVTSFYLENPVKVINQKTLESINSVLSEVQFHSIDTVAEKKLASFADGLPFEPLAESGADYIDIHTSDLPVALGDGLIRDQSILRENLFSSDNAEPKNTGSENSIERMIRVFENGSLPERTLYYLSLERALTEPDSVSLESDARRIADTSDKPYAGGSEQMTVPGSIQGLTDQMITPGSIPNIPMDWNRMLDEAGGEISGANLIALGENTGEAKEPTVERRVDTDLFRRIYGKIWKEDEQKKAASGDFRFLLTKRKKEDLMDALSDISGGDREYLSLALDRQLEYLSGRPEWTAVSEKPEKSLKTREETVRDIIEKTVNAQVDETSFRRIYEKIWTEDEQRIGIGKAVTPLLIKDRKDQFLDMLAGFSGQKKEILTASLDRQLEYLTKSSGHTGATESYILESGSERSSSGVPADIALKAYDDGTGTEQKKASGSREVFVPEAMEKSYKNREKAAGDIIEKTYKNSEEAARDIIEKTINTQVDDTVFRKIYERIWTEDDKKLEIGETVIPLLTTGGKARFVDMLSDISGQRREDLTVSLDRQLEHLTQSNGLTYKTGSNISGSGAERPAAGVPVDIAPKAYEDRTGEDHKKTVRSREEIIREVVERTFKTGEEAVRDIIEKTISAPVDDKVFRKIYGKIWTKNEKEKGLEGDISSLLANRKKGKFVGILSDVSGEDRQVLSEALERHLEYLASEPKRMSSLLNANRDEKEVSSSPAYDQDRTIDIMGDSGYGERLLTGRNMIGTVLQAENSPYSNSPSASAPVERLQESIVKYRELINTENVHLTSLRDVEEFTRPGENAFKVYPNQSSNLVLRDNTKESADSSKDITGEQAEKIVINEQRIDHMSLDLQELKTTLMYKEEELEKMKKTVGEQEKTIKRLEAVEGKKKDLSEDQRRQLMNRLKDEAIIAGMRNGV